MLPKTITLQYRFFATKKKTKNKKTLHPENCATWLFFQKLI